MTSRCLAAFPPPPWAALPPDRPLNFWRRLALVLLFALVGLACLGLVGLAGYSAHREHLWQDTLATIGLGEAVANGEAQVACQYEPGGRRSLGRYACHVRLTVGSGAAAVAEWDFSTHWGLYDNSADLGRGVRRLSLSPDGYAMVTTWAGLLDRAGGAFIGPLVMIAFCSIPFFITAWQRRGQRKLEAAAAAGHLIEVDILRRTKQTGRYNSVIWAWEVAYDDPANGARRRYYAYYGEGTVPLTIDWAASRGIALIGPRKPVALLTERLWPLDLDPTDYTRIVAAAAVDRESDHDARRNTGEYRDWTREAPSFAAQFDRAVALGEAGDGDACYTVGWLIFHGQGVARDSAVAAQWFERGALADDPRSQHNLAHLLHHGDGVVKNDRLATFWAQVAARRYAMPQDGQAALALRSNAAEKLSPRELDAIIQDARAWHPGVAPLASLS
ncbi:sel1 repeat family protein [Oleomonas cavernae]|uniref:Sel1 repeat family protein n=1 Tax=Oleomonas cavernae TaxID=2320859 RepID=A0A418WG53_9PROT|nr:sel1 repeat family protein [Oleomonas cavernae]RJF88952.1 sel1 repeat family protein [Oleomonas cavernae]